MGYWVVATKQGEKLSCVGPIFFDGAQSLREAFSLEESWQAPWNRHLTFFPQARQNEYLGQAVPDKLGSVSPFPACEYGFSIRVFVRVQGLAHLDRILTQ